MAVSRTARSYLPRPQGTAAPLGGSGPTTAPGPSSLALADLGEDSAAHGTSQADKLILAGEMWLIARALRTERWQGWHHTATTAVIS